MPLFIDDVMELYAIDHKQNTWRDKSEWRWVRGLLTEVIELLLSLVGLSGHPAERELMEIASICMNWGDWRTNRD